MTSGGKCAPLKLIAIVVLPHDVPLVMEEDHTAKGLKRKLATKPAGALEAGSKLAIMVGAVVGEEPTAETRDGAAVVRAEVLEEIRHPGERPGRQPRAQRRTRLVIETGHHRVDGRIARLDTRDRRLEHLCRRHLAPAHQLGEADPVVLVEFGESAHESSLVLGKAHALVPMTTVAGVPPFHGGGTDTSPLHARAQDSQSLTMDARAIVP